MVTAPQEMSSAPGTFGINTPCEFVHTLMKLQRAAQLITSTVELDPLLERVVNDLASSFGNVEVSVWLLDDATDDMVLRGVRGCTMHKKGARLKVGREGMVGHVARTGELHYAGDVRRDPYYIACEETTRSAVSLPLKLMDRVFGVLSVDHCERNAFSEDQLQVLQALAGHVAVAIENSRRFALERVRDQRIRQEAQEARAIQQALLPTCVPLVPGFAFETAWEPAGELAGDWFDLIALDDDRCGIVLADVAGKGMAAALLMSAARATLRSLARLKLSPGETLEQLNRTMMHDMPGNRFVTMVYGILDARSRTLTLASAGHLPPLLVSAEGICSFVAVDTGLPLGLAESQYPEYALTLAPGMKLLLYTDGITEAMDPADQEFGAERLMQHFALPHACVDGLIENVRRFSGSSAQSDDATALLVRSR